MNSNERKSFVNYRYLALLGAIFLITTVLGLTPWIYSDGVGEYSWVRTVIIDHDLDCVNEFQHYVTEFKEKYGWPEATDDLYPVQTPTGYQANKYPIGSALLWSPFFIMAHIFTAIVNLFRDAPIPMDGYSQYYVLFVTFGSALYGFLGIVFSFLIASRFFDEKTALIATIAIWFASSIPVYMYLYPSLPHNTAFFTVAIYFYYLMKTEQNRTLAEWAILGALGGLMTLTRLESIVLLSLPFLGLIYSLFSLSQDKKPAFAIKQAKGSMLFCVTAFLVFLPQMIVWKVVFGKYFLNSYSAMQRMVLLEKIKLFGALPQGKVLEPPLSALGSFLHFLSQPKIHETLWGASYGAFTWTPVIFFAFIGMILLLKKNRLFGIYCITGFLLLVYITSCSHKTGMSFGDRYLIKASPFFIPGVASLFIVARKKITERIFVLGVVFLIAWNGLFIVQYSTGLINRQGSISWKRMVVNQFTKAPAYLIKYAKPFITGRNSVYKGNNQ